MQQVRRCLLVTLLTVSGMALGQPDAACPEFPGSDRSHGGDTFTVGDWTLVAGAWLATCADGNALWVACTDEGGAVAIRLLLPDLEATKLTLRVSDDGTAVLSAGPLPNADGGIALDGADAERLTTGLSSSDALSVALFADGDEAAVRDVVFATAGFEEALPWLGCSDADACPVRSCGR